MRAGRPRVGRVRFGGDRGQVTAETAAVVPSLALLAALFVWGLTAAAAQIQCLDAARAGARAAARAEPAEAVRAAARSAAPEDAEVSVGREGPLVRVRVQAHLAGPGALGLEVDGEAVAHVEAR
ncbi:hypothetical protein HPT28_13320 [Streptomyces sp. JJ38]|nr:hypothetical protein [Streptomyces sp. JJ38]